MVPQSTMGSCEDTVDGQAASIGSSDVQVGNWDGGTFAVGGWPSNAVRTTPSFTLSNIFGLWSRTSLIHRTATAAEAKLVAATVASLPPSERLGTCERGGVRDRLGLSAHEHVPPHVHSHRCEGEEH